MAKSADAWRAIRWRARNLDLKARATELWSEKLQSTFYRQHSEIHSLYVTALVLLMFFIWKQSSVTMIGAIVFTISAGIADILVSRQECIVLQQNRKRIREILVESGLVDSAEGRQLALF